MSVLIITELGDVHAYAVAEALRRKGVQVVLWHTADFPTRSGETILFEGGARRMNIEGPDLSLSDFGFRTIWHRRPSYVIDESALHPADREFADLECSAFRRSLFSLLGQQAFWVNPPDAAARANRKPLQHDMAMDLGFSTPATLYTNEPPEIRAFIERQGGRIVYKPFRGMAWRDDHTCWMPYTSLVTEDSLVEDHLLRAVPGIYQELVEKDYELRITVMGDHVFGAKVLSQETSSGRLDWRKSYHELQIEPCKVSSLLADQCRTMLARLGLVFGCFDIVVTPAGEHVFLEVNEMGQFLFVEHYAGVPLLDAFSEFLRQARTDFHWHEEEEVVVGYADIQSHVQDLQSRLAKSHVSVPERMAWEGEARAQWRRGAWNG